jgi:hypothetical protein
MVGSIEVGLYLQPVFKPILALSFNEGEGMSLLAYFVCKTKAPLSRGFIIRCAKAHPILFCSCFFYRCFFRYWCFCHRRGFFHCRFLCWCTFAACVAMAGCKAFAFGSLAITLTHRTLLNLVSGQARSLSLASLNENGRSTHRARGRGRDED